MRISTAFPSNYIKAADLQGQNVTVVIDRVAVEEVGDGHKPVLYFQGHEKGMVLNKTNSNNIAQAYGDETDDWIGAEVVMFPAMVDFQGKSVEAIRIRIPPRRPANGGMAGVRAPAFAPSSHFTAPTTGHQPQPPAGGYSEIEPPPHPGPKF